jgi:hypothetical protein
MAGKKWQAQANSTQDKDKGDQLTFWQESEEADGNGVQSINGQESVKAGRQVEANDLGPQEGCISGR